jgi:hypothetical protein
MKRLTKAYYRMPFAFERLLTLVGDIRIFVGIFTLYTRLYICITYTSHVYPILRYTLHDECIDAGDATRKRN